MFHEHAPLDNLIARLHLAAKVRLLTGASVFTLHGDETIGLAPMSFSDGPTGVRGLTFAGGPRTALLPNATLIASTWSEETAYEVGVLLAEEAERQQIHVVLGPTINLHRSPLGGRLFEAYSEDPLLTGRLAAGYVRGLQASQVGACLKHLVANEAETDRHTVNSKVDEATLREVYLLPFEIAVEDADPWSVMAAYNDVNGVPATEQDHVINGIVKGEWRYRGLVMSDWFATKSAAAAANGGLDLVMPGPEGPWGENLVRAVEDGEVAESVVDDHVRRLLRLATRVGALGTPRVWSDELSGPSSPTRRDQLVRLAARGMTVLTNNGVLPLSKGKRVALIGRHAIETIDMGGGSAQVNAPYQIGVAEGIRAILGDLVEVVDGVEVRTRAIPARPAEIRDPQTGKPGMRVRVLGADGRVIDDRHVDEASTLIGFDDNLPEPAARAVLSGVVQVEGAAEIGVIGDGSWVVRVGEESHQVTLSLEGSDVGEFILRPPGWTTRTVGNGALPLEAEVVPTGKFGRVGLAARPAARPQPDVLAHAQRAAVAADLAVVVVGLTEEQETEAVDKTTLALPGDQDALVAAVAAVAKHTVVVVNAATPVLMPWIDRVDAVLWAGIPGQEGGHAVAAALFNDIEPSGRLVTSFPVVDGASPAWKVEPTDGVLEYTEKGFIGYRGYAARKAPAPAFWFGHGLGYGTWSYGAVTTSLSPSGEPLVQVDVTNTSQYDSREVVQVYFEPVEVDQPVRLVGWSAVDVAAGATATVSVTCDPRMWRRWDVAEAAWTSLDGRGEFLVARGLGDGRARTPSNYIP